MYNLKSRNDLLCRILKPQKKKKYRLGFDNIKTIAFRRTLIRKWKSNTNPNEVSHRHYASLKKESLWVNYISRPYKSTIKSAIKIGQRTWTGVSWIIGHTSRKNKMKSCWLPVTITEHKYLKWDAWGWHWSLGVDPMLGLARLWVQSPPQTLIN